MLVGFSSAFYAQRRSCSRPVRFIRYRPLQAERGAFVLAAFVRGAIFATLGGGISSSIARRRRAHSSTPPKEMDVVGATVFAPVFEETFSKYRRRPHRARERAWPRELDGLDGAIYGGARAYLALPSPRTFFTSPINSPRIAPKRIVVLLGDGPSVCLTARLRRARARLIGWQGEELIVKLARRCSVSVARSRCMRWTTCPDVLRRRGLVLMLLVSWVIDIPFLRFALFGRP